MKKRARKLAILLITAMLSATACSPGNNAVQTNTTGGKEVTANNPSGLEPVTLHFIFFGDKRAATDQVWEKIADYTRDTLNADFDVQFFAGGPASADYKQKFLVKAAGGDKWDLNFDSNWTCYFSMVAQDAYMNLDELLPKYAPDLYKKYVDADLLDAMKSKGHITALPWTMSMSQRNIFQWRGDLADAAGIDVDPKSIKDWESMDALLAKLKAAYPDRYMVECSKYLLAQGGYAELDEDRGFVFDLNDPECKVIPFETTEAFRDMAKYGEKWQKDGYIWKDVLVDKLDHNSLINEGKLITKMGTHEYANSKRPWVEEGARWDYNEVYADGLYANRSALSNAMCISATSENPERTLMFLNMLETDRTLYDLVMYGIEGVTYELNGEEAVFPEGMDSASTNYMGWGGQWALWKPQFMRPDASYDKGFWEEEANYVNSSDKNVVSPLDGFNFDPTAVKTEYAQRIQIYFDAKKLIEVGLAGNYEDAITKLNADSKAAGLDKLIAEYQRQVDEYLASKK